MPSQKKKQAHRGQTRRGRLTRLSRVTEGMLNPALAARGFTHSRIVTEWPAIAGDAASWSEPANITFPKGKSRDGTLVVNIRSGRGPEMQMLIPGIVKNCNAVFGYAAIARITLTQVAMETARTRRRTRAPEGEIDSPEVDSPPLPVTPGASPELRQTLENLGKSVNRRRSR